MNNNISFSEPTGRRRFLKHVVLGSAGLTLGAVGGLGCSSFMKQAQSFGSLKRGFNPRSGRSRVSFVTAKDQREAAYNALKPLESEILEAIGTKQVLIKVNMGQVAEDVWLNATDPNFVRGILDFLTPVYDREIVVAESTAAGAISTLAGFENYGYMPILREYGNVRFADMNDATYSPRSILSPQYHPQTINIIDTFMDQNIYMISATRLKTHNNVIATLSLKNVVMAAPINHYTWAQRQGRNEKPLMHSGGNRELSYNLFRLATMGIQPDLAVLDGVVGMEGNGPVRGTEVEQGVAVASTDWVAADRLGVELMGMDYNEIKYLQWCSEAGMGEDDLDNIEILGPEYRPHIVTYRPHDNIDSQREWLQEDFSA